MISGIVGVKKFAFDIWGDAVNTAARMEQNSDLMKINVSGSTYELIKDQFECTSRGKIKAKERERWICISLNRRSRKLLSSSHQHGLNRIDQDFDIHQQTHVFDVKQVELHSTNHLLNILSVTVLYHTPRGNARFHF